MKKKQVLLLLSTILTIIVWSCQSSEIPVENELTLSNNTSTLHKIISDAKLFIFVEKKGYGDWPEGQTVNVHRVTNEWQELEATWNNRLTGTSWDNPGGDVVDMDNSIDHLTPNDSSGGYWLSTSINDIVEAWKVGSPNYGILLEQGATSPYIKYRSGNYDDVDDAYAPYIKLTYDDGTEKIIATEDTYIWEIFPETNNGNSAYLYTGMVGKRLDDGTIIIGEKRVLLKFDIQFDEGCTYCFGYWRIHANPDTKRYNDTWDELDNGPETPFFNSGMTYLEILWKAPKGDEYVLLAHQYIAAELNQLKGASIPSEVKDAFNSATELLSGAQTAERTEWMALTSLLDDYNSGLIGPGYCCDDHESGPKSKDKKHKKWHKKDKKCKPKP